MMTERERYLGWERRMLEFHTRWGLYEWIMVTLAVSALPLALWLAVVLDSLLPLFVAAGLAAMVLVLFDFTPIGRTWYERRLPVWKRRPTKLWRS